MLNYEQRFQRPEAGGSSFGTDLIGHKYCLCRRGSKAVTSGCDQNGAPVMRCHFRRQGQYSQYPNIRIDRSAARAIWLPSWPINRGVSRSSRDGGRDAVDATASARAGSQSGMLPVSGNRARNDTMPKASSHGPCSARTPAAGNPVEMCADGEVVWSWRPKSGAKLGGCVLRQPARTLDIRQVTGAIELVSPGRARRKPLKPSAQGRPSAGFTCDPPVRMSLHTGLRVPAGARPSLRPYLRKGQFQGQARACCAARTRTRARPCVRVHLAAAAPGRI